MLVKRHHAAIYGAVFLFIKINRFNLFKNIRKSRIVKQNRAKQRAFGFNILGRNAATKQFWIILGNGLFSRFLFGIVFCFYHNYTSKILKWIFVYLLDISHYSREWLNFWGNRDCFFGLTGCCLFKRDSGFWNNFNVRVSDCQFDRVGSPS